MNKIIYLVFMLFVAGISGNCQKYEFTTQKSLECLPVISQGATGTCWSFSSTSFLEAEILRACGQKVDLSEMFSVRNTYLEKAENYVSRQGKSQFGEGGLNHDVINSIKKYGFTLEAEYSGKSENSKHDHSKMILELENIVKKAVTSTPANYPQWRTDFKAVLDTYLGNIEKITPKKAKELSSNYKVKIDDYISLTSFTHAPMYSPFILNILDNFANGSFYNIPLDEFMENIDHALDKGYTLALDSDVSESTFSATNGIAVIPENESDSTSILTEIKPEKKITQEYRQQEFENYNTTDDHLMHIVGKVIDQKGNVYYKVKNSWGVQSGKEGYLYMSTSYLRLKAISVMVHKNALKGSTRKSLNV